MELLVWALLGAVIGVLSGLIRLPVRQETVVSETEGTEEIEEGAGVSEELHDIMLEAFRRIAPNSRGAGSCDLLNLSTAIQKLEAGEDVPAGVCVYLLEKVGAGDLAEKARGAGV